MEPEELVVRAAWLYYEVGLTQQQVATTLATSRPTVSRLIARARAEGVVQIQVVAQLPESLQAEQALLGALPGLTAAVVAPVQGGEDPVVAASRAAARLVEDAASVQGTDLTVGWGRTLGHVARMVRPRRTREVAIMDAVGYAAGGLGASSIEVTRVLSERLGAVPRHLPAPAVVRPASAAVALLDTFAVAEAIQRARTAKGALISVGGIGDYSSLRDLSLLENEEWTDVVRRGAVGEVLGRFFDSEGQEIPLPNIQWIGLSPSDLRSKSRVIAVVSGSDKARMTVIAIRTGLVTELVTDERTAKEILRLLSSERADAAG